MPATDEVWRLQNRPDRDCVLFRKMVQGHDRPSRTSMQGFYVFSPGGELLGERNSRRPDTMVRMLQRALREWEALPESERRLPKGTSVTPDHRWEDSYPEGGLVLRSTVRDLPRSGDPERRRRRTFNRDAVWFSKAEARQWLPAVPKVGARQQLPRGLVERLVRFHLLDGVHGQVLSFGRRDVGESAVLTEVVDRDGDKLRLRISGSSQAKAEGRWSRALQTSLRGFAEFDLAAGRFTSFELVAIGLRSGRTQYNGRRRQTEPSRIGFLFELAPDNWRVAPAYAPIYGARWIKHRRRR